MEKNTDLTTIPTRVRLTQAERMTAQMRHHAAMNDAQLAEKKARNARRGLKPIAIGQGFVPRAVSKVFAYVKAG
ncbi:hypothetical protein AX768_09025 [Burkholderia sp. PAMC 28687]|uniref:hypothetical protein n=1 Tax=Burkholderia sp. PAMC 28687 TaxID=1795874 RepID=UPI0007819793|nr:hypothetical protein [Burkholderia sp. PAMC 28687]AMM14213.1 hypothetical protein AX768_09025 [Burkholderia sp. PAMC 28687]